jgi:hypothetical protein
MRFAGRHRAPGLLCGVLLIGLAIVGASGEARSEVQPASPGPHRVRAQFASFAELDRFLEEHPDVELLTERPILEPVLAVDRATLAEITARRIPHRVIPTASSSTLRDGLRFTNYSHGTMIAALQAHADSASHLVALTVIGQTHDGNDLHAVKVSDNPALDEDEPVVLFVGVHHAQETIGVDCLLLLLDTLVDGYDTDPHLRSLVDGCEIWLVPMLNPDGWLRIERGELDYWRKNCRDNNRNRVFDADEDGVDLNRNYARNWRQAGSDDPRDSDYRGRGPFSEPEVRAMRDLVLATRPALVLSYHMAGEYIIMPWECADGPPPDAAAYRRIGEELAATIVRDEGSGTYGLFEGAGSGGYLDDWVYAETGGFSYTLEVSSSAHPRAIDQVAEHHRAGALYAIERVASGPQLTGRVRDASSGVAVIARVDVGGINTADLAPRLSEATTGRFRRLVNPGTYALRIVAGGYEPIMITDIDVSAGSPTVVDVELVPRPSVVLSSPWPNPARSSAALRYFVPHRGAVRFDVYTVGGRLMRTLVDRVREIGWWEIEWDGRDQTGHQVPSGVYLLHIRHGGGTDTRRLVVVH